MTDSELPAAKMGVLSSDDQTRHQITAGLRAHNKLIFDFTKAWYSSPYTFRTTTVLGFSACKIWLDLGIFHDLFVQYRFQTVIELGTAAGGATLWFAILMDLLGIEGGHVYSIDTAAIDPEGPQRPAHPRITYIQGSSSDPEVKTRLEAVLAETVGRDAPLLLDLDSSHLAPHVFAELELWAPLVPEGSWLVVEDTNGAPVVTDPATGKQLEVEGPMAALFEYLDGHPGEWLREVVCERMWLSMNPHGWLLRTGPYLATPIRLNDGD